LMKSIAPAKLMPTASRAARSGLRCMIVIPFLRA
jgi:hypothetical protein